MKKTIAILLVLVIGMVGVWAATADLKLSTTVPAETYIYVSDTTANSTTTYADFKALVNSTAVNSTAFSLEGGDQNVGRLHYMTNDAAGVDVKMAATVLKSGTNGTTGGNNNTIGYTAKVVVNETTTISIAAGDGASLSNPIAIPGSETILTIGYYPINIALVVADFQKAPADTYTGNIIFNFVSST